MAGCAGWTAIEQRIDERRDRVEQVLAVVEDQEHARAVDRIDQHIERRALGLITQAKGGGDRRHNTCGIGEGRELHEHGVWFGLGEREGEAGLTAARQTVSVTSRGSGSSRRWRSSASSASRPISGERALR